MKNTLYVLISILIVGCGSNTEKAEQLFDEGRYDEAIAIYDEKLESRNDKDVRYNRARAYEEKGDIEKAEEEYMAILERDPEYLPAKSSLSKLAYEQEDYARSIMLSGDALKVNENSARAHYLQARAKHQLGYAEAAMEGYDKAISINNEFGEAYLYRGALKQSIKNPTACEDFKAAEKLNTEGAKEARKRFCN